MSNKAIKFLFWLYILILACDILTTSINGPLVTHLESNPLYKYLGVSGITVLNLGLIIVLYYAYKIGSVNARWTITLMIVTICIIRGVVSWNNLMIYLHPPTLAQAVAVTTAQKVATVRRFAWNGILMFIPGGIAYLFHTIDHEVKKK